ncbi:MAG: 4'-phosphopantetheinyl transferase superfamily protein [Clostridia bacterium]|nr:4'-phosphopantetheinyl transferase superfamily protein [Clostridia bacterium]
MKVEYLNIDYPNSASLKDKRIIEHNTAYSLLDKMLSECGINEYEILKNENGKPYLKDNSIHFSISHTDGLCAVCLNDMPIGIDCEKIDPSFKNRAQPFAKRYFTSCEIELLEKNNYGLVTFFKIWTGKEAVIKKYGYNSSHITKIDTTKEDIETIILGEYIISIFK